LPADKLRVLVSLYHQSATFITKENLSARIDEAFIHRPRRDVAYTTGPESSFKMLEAKVAERRALPKFGSSLVTADTKAHHPKEGDSWSEVRDPRQRAVMTSLYGALARGKPGYEALEDEKERIKRQLRED
ncbi:hypothetical protein BD413DRAFT_436301, partial [Trametes elegans]